MAIPTYVDASTGSTDATGAWAHTCQAPGAAGRIMLLHVLQDGVTNGAVTLTSVTNMEDLAGTDNTMTKLDGPNADDSFNVGDPLGLTGRHHVWIGRSLSTSAPVVSGGNSTSEDVYVRCYQFDTVNPGALVTDVIENGAETANDLNYSSSPASGVIGNVTTLGPDRIMVWLLAVDDDASLGTISGDNPAIIGAPNETYSSSSGTDGAIFMFAIAQVTAGAQTGGFGTLTPSSGSGQVCFALIGTTPSGTQPRPAGVDFNDPGFFMRGLRRAWHRRPSGIFVPELGWV